MVKAIFYVLGGFCVLVMGTLGYLGIALLMGIESACIPLPSELIMPYAGALSDPGVAAALLDTYKSVGLTTLPEFNLFLAALAGALGALIVAQAGWRRPGGPNRTQQSIQRLAELVVAGAVWMLAVALFNIGVQLSAPRWVAGSSLAAFQASIAGGIAMV